MRRLLLLALLLVAVTASMSGTGASAATAPCAGTSAAITHVVVIVEENHYYTQVAGHMPYLDALAAKCGLATNLNAETHPSLPNYIAMTSGQIDPVFAGRDCIPKPGCNTNDASIFGQVQWNVFAQSMPSNCYAKSVNNYVARHTAAPYYTGVATACKTYDRPMTAFDPANLRAFTYLIPDLAHDMHGSPITTGDAYAQSLIDPILASADYQAGHVAIFVTFDEGKQLHQTIWTSVIARNVPASTKVGTAMTHYSLLRAWEDVLGANCLAAACQSGGLAAAFNLN